MKWFNYKRAHEWYGDDITNYPDDINQIIRAFETLEGVRVSPYEAAELWRLRSDAYDASWLGLPECDDDVIKDIKEFVPGFEIVDSEQEPEDDGEPIEFTPEQRKAAIAGLAKVVSTPMDYKGFGECFKAEKIEEKAND